MASIEKSNYFTVVMTITSIIKNENNSLQVQIEDSNAIVILNLTDQSFVKLLQDFMQAKIGDGLIIAAKTLNPLTPKNSKPTFELRRIHKIIKHEPFIPA